MFFFSISKTQHLEEIAGTVSEFTDAVNLLTLNVIFFKDFKNIKSGFNKIIIQFLQTDCSSDMGGITDRLSSLKHNISGITEPTQQLFNKFVIEESLK